MEAEDPDLEVFIRRARRGDEAAFDALFADIQPRLLRYLRTLVREDAEDVSSEAWLQIARDLRGFEGDSAGFRAWTARIARNRAMDHLRHRGRRPADPVPVDRLVDLVRAESTEALVLDELATEAALGLVASLPRDQAEAVLLRVLFDLDARTAGEVLGKRPGAVRTAAHRGLRNLAKRLGRLPDAPAAKRAGEPVTSVLSVALEDLT